MEAFKKTVNRVTGLKDDKPKQWQDGLQKNPKPIPPIRKIDNFIS